MWPARQRSGSGAACCSTICYAFSTGNNWRKLCGSCNCQGLPTVFNELPELGRSGTHACNKSPVRSTISKIRTSGEEDRFHYLRLCYKLSRVVTRRRGCVQKESCGKKRLGSRPTHSAGAK